MDRYDKNLEVAKKIIAVVGYEIISFDPNWSFRNKFPANSCEHRDSIITDEAMGRLALALGYEWHFRIPLEERKEHLEKLIQFNQKVIDQARNAITQSVNQTNDAGWDVFTDNCREKIKNAEENIKKNKEELEFMKNLKGTLK